MPGWSCRNTVTEQLAFVAKRGTLPAEGEPLGTAVAVDHLTMQALEKREDPEAVSPIATVAEGVQILIVEDDDDALEALMAIVETDGYSAEGASSAKEALDIVARRVPHCVVLDLGLPGINGIELTRQLRSAFGNELVLIAVTGNTDASALSAAEEAGIDYLLSKPLDVARFRRIVPPLN